MEREHENAILSLQRLPDWGIYLDYLATIVHELEVSLGHVDPNDAMTISRTQGARFALLRLIQDMPNEKSDDE